MLSTLIFEIRPSVCSLGWNLNLNGKTGASTFLPSSPYWAKSERPTDWIQGVSVENLIATASKAAPVAVAMWLEKSFSKKFQSPGVPFTPYIATRSAESTPSLKNLRPSPGARGYESDG